MDRLPANGKTASKAPLHALPTLLRGGRSDLPVSLTSLVGREQELDQAVSLLRRPDLRLLTLTGPGGIGKTRLALQIACGLTEFFADGVQYIPLATTPEPELLDSAIARTLGLNHPGDVPVHTALVSALHQAETLLLLDNFEHLIGAVSLLTDLLKRCPRLKMLVTSRVLLRAEGEHAVRVSPLTLPDPGSIVPGESAAVQLFAERAQAVAPSFAITETTLPLVAEICRRLDGLPLAIELAATRVRYLSLPALIDRLDHRLPLLTGGSRNQPNRLQTMRNAIAWSHDLLDLADQRLFRRLAVFTGGFSLEAAEHIGAVGSTHNVLDTLIALIDASLLQTEILADGTLRYRMLETIRDFAAEQLAASDEAKAIHEAHALYFLGFAEQNQLADLLLGSDRVLTSLESDHANLQSALAWLEETGNSGLLVRLTIALGRFWHTQGHFREGLWWLERVLADDIATVRPERSAILLHLGIIDVYQGRNQEGRQHLTEGLAGGLDQRDAILAAGAFMALGNMALQVGDNEDAAAKFRESVTAAEAIPDERLVNIMVGRALGNLAVLDRLQGNHILATKRLEDALHRLRSSNDPVGTIVALGDLGDLARDQGNAVRALTFYRKALRLAGGNTATRTVTAIIEGVAAVIAAEGQPGVAARLLGAASGQRERIGLRYRAVDDEIATSQALDSIRAELGEQAFSSAWEAGRRLSWDQAVAEALDPAALPVATTSISLTPREQEILRLLVAGQSNGSIADALFISRRTVEHHVARIFPKLGVRTRAAAVAAAIAAGLSPQLTLPGE
jgi:non-specific serine/threonine protein kinase